MSSLTWLLLAVIFLGGPSVFLWFLHKFDLPTM